MERENEGGLHMRSNTVALDFKDEQEFFRKIIHEESATMQKKQVLKSE